MSTPDALHLASCAPEMLAAILEASNYLRMGNPAAAQRVLKAAIELVNEP